MTRYFYQNFVIWLLCFFNYFPQDCTTGLHIIISINWRSPVFMHKAYIFIFHLHILIPFVIHLVLLPLRLLYVTEKQVSKFLKRYKKTVEHTTSIILQLRLSWQACPPQSQNQSCIWRWKWLFIFMLKHLLLKNSSVKHSLEYIFSNYSYILLFL